jgi:hypothetical protein
LPRIIERIEPAGVQRAMLSQNIVIDAASPRAGDSQSTRAGNKGGLAAGEFRTGQL